MADECQTEQTRQRRTSISDWVRKSLRRKKGRRRSKVLKSETDGINTSINGSHKGDGVLKEHFHKSISFDPSIFYSVCDDDDYGGSTPKSSSVSSSPVQGRKNLVKSLSAEVMVHGDNDQNNNNKMADLGKAAAARLASKDYNKKYNPFYEDSDDSDGSEEIVVTDSAYVSHAKNGCKIINSKRVESSENKSDHGSRVSTSLQCEGNDDSDSSDSDDTRLRLRDVPDNHRISDVYMDENEKFRKLNNEDILKPPSDTEKGETKTRKKSSVAMTLKKWLGMSARTRIRIRSVKAKTPQLNTESSDEVSSDNVDPLSLESRVKPVPIEDLLRGNHPDPDVTYKILVIGESSVGKTSIINVAKGMDFGEFRKNLMTTVGVDFMNQEYDIDGARIRLQIWDTAGQERFRTITRFMYRGTKGLILTFDVTDRRTFEALNYWLMSLDEDDLNGEEIILVGNKCDLWWQRQVTKAAAEKFAAYHSMRYFETSAKENVGIRQVFPQMAFDLVERFHPRLLKAYNMTVTELAKEEQATSKSSLREKLKAQNKKNKRKKEKNDIRKIVGFKT